MVDIGAQGAAEGTEARKERTMDEPRLDPQHVTSLAETRFVGLYELCYEDGTRYFVASRRRREDLLALKDDAERARALPDAVSCCLVLEIEGREPRMVLFHEYRYPTGQYLLSVPSGLIDARDADAADPAVAAMTREVAEECGIVLDERDTVTVINPLLYNTPGLTDESTALLCVVVRRASEQELTPAGAEGTERFDGFELLTRDEVWEVLHQGRDMRGNRYPMVAWAAMTYFATDQWR